MAALRVAIHTQRPIAEMLAETAAPLAFTMTVRGHVGARPLHIEADALRACDSDTARVELIAQRAYEAHAGTAAAGVHVAEAPSDFECTLFETRPLYMQWHGLVYERLPTPAAAPELGAPRVLASKDVNAAATLHVSVV